METGAEVPSMVAVCGCCGSYLLLFGRRAVIAAAVIITTTATTTTTTAAGFRGIGGGRGERGVRDLPR